MSITRDYSLIVFECDDCQETLETGTHDWYEALGRMREAGWRSEREGDQWRHRCPDCQ
jgi:hypothetical protein